MSIDPNPDLDRVKQACQTLIEHFDSVQIFVTRCEQGELDGTINIQYGQGNWYARYGQIHSWVTKEDEALRVDARED